jgi:hypothetical protein
MLRNLFDGGYLDEMAICRDHRARYLAERGKAPADHVEADLAPIL